MKGCHTDVRGLYALGMAPELQRLVNSLGDRLGRSVAIDDQRLRILAYTGHTGEVDDARLRAIMQRERPQEVVDHFAASGALDKVDLFTRPVQPESGITIERYVMPIRYEGALQGFIWLMASDGPLTDDHTQAIRQAAERAAQILHRDHLTDESRLGRIREYLRDLLADDASLHDHAARQLIEHELIRSGPVTALVVTVPHEDGRPFTDKRRQELEIGLDRACRHAPPESAIQLVRADHAVVVIAHPPAGTQEIDHLTAAIKKQVSATTHCRPDDCYVGIGESHATLSEAYDSYTEARQAADVARVIRVLGTVVRYSQLGIHGVLTEVPPDRLRRGIHPGLLRLLEYDTGRARLVETLETYFKNTGDVRRTADQLCIHRATVHYRLRRAEEITGLDLSDGDDWLALHLGLKVAQFVRLR